MSTPISLDIAAIQAGSMQAFEELFHQWYERLCRYAMQYVARPDDARDLVQGVFVKLWEKRQQLSPDLNIGAYLHMSVRNACLNQIAHMRVRHAHETVVKAGPPALGRSPEESYEFFELVEQVRKGLDALPDRCREAFLLSREHGLTYREIAERMNISPKTVEGQIGKALRLLKESLGGLLIIYLWG